MLLFCDWGSCSPKGDLSEISRNVSEPQLCLKCQAVCQYFQAKMFGFHSQNANGLDLRNPKETVIEHRPLA